MRITKNTKTRFVITETAGYWSGGAEIDCELDMPCDDVGVVVVRAGYSANLSSFHARKLGQWLLAAADRLEAAGATQSQK